MPDGLQDQFYRFMNVMILTALLPIAAYPDAITCADFFRSQSDPSSVTNLQGISGLSAAERIEAIDVALGKQKGGHSIYEVGREIGYDGLHLPEGAWKFMREPTLDPRDVLKRQQLVKTLMTVDRKLAPTEMFSKLNEFF